MKMFLPFRKFAQMILESLMDEEKKKSKKFIDKDTIKDALKEINFESSLKQILPNFTYAVKPKTF